MSRSLPLFALVLALCVAFIARVEMSLRPGLWGDEIFSLAMATGHSLEHPTAAADPALGDYVDPPGVVLSDRFRHYTEHDRPPAGSSRVLRAVLLSDTSPPLYYLLLHWWTRVAGTSDVALRLLSLLTATLALPFIWAIGKELAGPKAAWTAALLYAFSPVSVFYSLEGRMYSLLWLLASVLAWQSLLLRRRGAKPALVTGWIVAAAGGMLTHYFFLFAWAAMLAWLLWRPGKLSRGTIVSMAGVVTLAVLPWYLQVPASLGRWRVSGHWLAEPLHWPGAVTRPFELAWSLLAGGSFWGGSPPVDLCLAVAYLALVVWIMSRGLLARVFAGDLLLLWLWVGASVLGLIGFDVARHTSASLVPRYVLAALPAAMLLAAVGMEQLPGKMHALFLSFVLLAWTAGLRPIVFDRARPGAAYPALAARLGGWARPSDLVLVHSIPSGVVGLSRYLSRPIPMASWIEPFGSRGNPHDLDVLLAGRKRVALVQVHNLGKSSLAETWLRSRWPIVREEVWVGSTNTLTSAIESLPPAQQRERREHELIEIFYFDLSERR